MTGKLALLRLAQGVGLAAVLVTLLPNASSACAAPHPYNKQFVHSSGGLAQSGELCFAFMASISAGDFFKGLEYIKPSSGVSPDGVFRRKRQVVSTFPETLDIFVGFNTLGCGARIPKRPATPAELASLVQSIQIEAGWKSNLELRPAQLIVPQKLAGKPQVFQKAALWFWGYALQVRAKDVPLTDHLVVSVFDANHMLLGRVSIDLTSALLPPSGSPR